MPKKATMLKLQQLYCFILTSALAGFSGASVSVYLHTYETTPKYVKGNRGDQATCGQGVSEALKFNILDPGLTAKRGVSSFKSVDFNRHYLVDVDSYIYINRYSGRSKSFERAGSFTTRRNHFYKGTNAYESTEYPNQFLMCRNGYLVLERVRTTRDMGRASFITEEVGEVDSDWTPCTKSCGGGTQKPKKRTCITAFWCEEPRSRPCNAFACEEKDVCDSNPCQNGGTCRSFADGSYHCTCRAGFTGDRCQTALNPCRPNPCDNGGKCVRQGSQSYSCSCKAGFSGKRCEKVDNPCLPNPCKNKGTCVKTGSDYVCRCKAGFSGKHCESVQTARCNPNPCVNGKCIETGTGIKCDCDIGYYGHLCQKALKKNEWSPCSRSCGGGTRYKSKSFCREKKVEDCPRNYEECNTFRCPDAKCSGNYQFRFQDPSACCRKSKSSECGMAKQPISGIRIIGGVVSKQKQWPSMAALYQKSANDFFCAGIIIHKQWILTAGHCAEAYPASDLKLLVGTTHRVNLQSTHKWVDVSKIFFHPDYKNPKHDIALLKLKSSLKFNDAVRKVCLPNGEKVGNDVKCFAPGWGVAFVKDIPLRKGSDALKHVGLKTFPLDTCVQAYAGTSYSVAVTNQTLCAGLLRGGKDTCIGDSGGPLLCQRKSSCDWYVAGVTAFGPNECGIGYVPAGFMDVVQYENWIYRTMDRN